MRLLALLLLLVLGVVASAAGPGSPRGHDSQVAPHVDASAAATLLAAHGPSFRAPARVVASSFRTPGARGLTGGDAAALHHAPFAPDSRRDVDVQSSTDPPAVAGSARRSQPEGRGPPGEPRAA